MSFTQTSVNAALHACAELAQQDAGGTFTFTDPAQYQRAVRAVVAAGGDDVRREGGTLQLTPSGNAMIAAPNWVNLTPVISYLDRKGVTEAIAADVQAAIKLEAEDVVVTPANDGYEVQVPALKPFTLTAEEAKILIDRQAAQPLRGSFLVGIKGQTLYSAYFNSLIRQLKKLSKWKRTEASTDNAGKGYKVNDYVEMETGGTAKILSVDGDGNYTIKQPGKEPKKVDFKQIYRHLQAEATAKATELTKESKGWTEYKDNAEFLAAMRAAYGDSPTSDTSHPGMTQYQTNGGSAVIGWWDDEQGLGALRKSVHGEAKSKEINGRGENRPTKVLGLDEWKALYPDASFVGPVRGNPLVYAKGDDKFTLAVYDTKTQEGQLPGTPTTEATYADPLDHDAMVGLKDWLDANPGLTVQASDEGPTYYFFQGDQCVGYWSREAGGAYGEPGEFEAELEGAELAPSSMDDFEAEWYSGE